MKLIGFILSIIAFCVAPDQYRLWYCIVCGVIYCIPFYQSISICVKEGRLLSFNIFFFAVLFACTYLVPVFLYDDICIPLYNPYICRCSSIVALAANVYFWGWSKAHVACIKENEMASHFFVSPQIAKVMDWLCIIVTIWFLFSLRSFLRVASIEQNDLGEKLLITCTKLVFSLALLCKTLSSENTIVSLRDYFKSSVVVISCYIIVIFASLFFIGDRTLPAFLLIMITVVINNYVRKIRFSTLLLTGIIALAVFYTVGQTRKNSVSYRTSSASEIIALTNSTVSNTESVLLMFSDYYAATQSLYLAEQWKQSNSGHLFYPLRIIPITLQPIPYAPTVMSEFIYDKSYVDISSAVLLTNQYSNLVRSIEGGFGTHCVADVYVSWGLIGVILIFYLFGWLISTLEMKSNDSLYALIAYFGFLANVMYIPRGTIYGSYRMIVYEILLVWLVSRLTSTSIIIKKNV